jgi:signal transduction histidine kinase
MEMGVAAWPPGQTGEGEPAHVVQFYSDDEYLVQELSRFIGTALAAGECALVIATEAHRTRLAERLRDRGLDISRAISQQRYVAMDAAQTLSRIMQDGMPDAVRFADLMGEIMTRLGAAGEHDPPRISAFGEMVALLWEEAKGEAAHRLEQLWNELAKTHSFSLRCAYPIALFDREAHGQILQQLCAEHARVIPEESYSALPSDDARQRAVVRLQHKAQALQTQEALRRVNEELGKEIAERKRAERNLEESEKSLRQLSLYLLRTQDEERRRIGRDLHDSLGQFLAVLKMNLDALALRAGAKKGERKQIAQCIRLTEQSIKEVRTISYLLYPPMLEEMGLQSAIPWYLDGFAARSGIRTSFEVSGDFVRLPRDLELALFRALQESLTNVHRHSGSPSAEIRLLLREEMAVLEVRDKGRGISAEVLERGGRDWVGAVGVGLRGMNERMRQLGGRVELSSTKKGTTVIAMAPVAESFSGALDGNRGATAPECSWDSSSAATPS